VSEEPPDQNTAVTPDRALPEWAIDLLMYGVPKYIPAPKIWGKVVSIAMSAQARGWTSIQFVNEVSKTERRKNKVGQRRWTSHHLWEQVLAYSRDSVDAFKELDKAWAAATDNLLSEGLRTPEDLIANAIERAWAWEDRLGEGTDNLSVAEASVMSYVIAEIKKRRMTRVTCPCRAVGEFAKIPHVSANRTLKSLANKGFLVQYSRGTWSESPSKRKAAIYGLSDPFSLKTGDGDEPLRAGT
jgi:hypothetical protein